MGLRLKNWGACKSGWLFFQCIGQKGNDLIKVLNFPKYLGCHKLLKIKFSTNLKVFKNINWIHWWDSYIVHTWWEKCDKLEFSDKGFISSWTADGLPLYPAESSILGGDTLPWREELRLPERLRNWLWGERDLERSVSSLCLPMMVNIFTILQKMIREKKCQQKCISISI